MSDDGGLKVSVDDARAEVIAAILMERLRQEQVEGFDAKHDDDHSNGELAAAAGCYAIHAAAQTPGVPSHVVGLASAATQDCWPWDWRWWKPKDAERNLVRAGALIVAELERLKRAGAP